MLTADTVIGYLRARGIAATGARELGGGVSNTVLRVTTEAGDLIVKQSLARLQVADEWLAPQGRILTEAKALQVAGAIIPRAVPDVVLADPDRFVLVIRAAPEEWSDWKVRLLGGTIEPDLAARVGAIVGAIHVGTLGDAGLGDAGASSANLEALRIQPYYEKAAAELPQWTAAFTELAEQLRTQRRCLVHGDLSPKNILVSSDDGTVWLIDFEVAHFGDPRFDLAFLSTHLAIKAVHRPANADSLHEAIRSFLAAYSAAAGPELSPDVSGVLRHIGALLLARVHGKSPVEYLDDRGRGRVERLGAVAIAGELRTIDDFLEAARRVGR